MFRAAQRVLIGMSALLLLTAPLAAQAPATRRGPSLPEGTRALRDLAYVPNGSKAQALDLFLPAATGGHLPVVIWIHGGAWWAGSKSQCPALGFLNHGYAVASVEYRFSQEAIFPAQIQDCQAALRFLRAHAQEYGLDPERFGVWGGSAGGHLVALLGTAGGTKTFPPIGGNEDQSDRVQAVCDWFGPADLTTMPAPKTDSPAAPNAKPGPLAQLLGGPVADHLDRAKAASPVTYVSKDAPPFLIMHGDKDPLVPLAQSQELDAALQKAGAKSTLFVVPGAGHGFGGPDIFRRVADFFDTNLQKP